MKLKQLSCALFLAATVSACSTMDGTSTDNTSTSMRSGYGVVDSVQVSNRDSNGIVGAIGGAVVGGLLGNQVGSGRGNTAATIAGAAGGAYAGREIEKRTGVGGSQYKIAVRMSDGSYQTFTQASQPALRPGDRVRVDNGVVTPY